MIVAGAVVGSGELIATTATGAEAGFYLMWLILIGCLIKVFVQVEMGRYAICTGETSLKGMSEVPGPRIGRANWVLWFWLLTIVVTTGQLGGIVGGVGQSLAISTPVTKAGKEYNELMHAETQMQVMMRKQARERPIDEFTTEQELDRRIGEGEVLLNYARYWNDNKHRKNELRSAAKDHLIWAGIVALASTVLLVRGRYGFIQLFVTVLVGLFTLMTIVNVILLQMNSDFGMTVEEFKSGLSFQLPPKEEGVFPLATALATFGIIGVAAGEMVFYPYWCIEKGYAKFVGPNDGSGDWVRRARGWVKVLRWDAFLSMVVYTISTVAFYVLGAAILNRVNLVPKGMEMIRTLSVMYEPVFGVTAQSIFLVGAIAVLYSTFFVTNASKARMCSDALRLFNLRADTEAERIRWLKIFSAAFPLMCFAVYWSFPKPTTLVLAGGVMQSILLPVMACTAMWFRYRKCDPRVLPGRAWDLMLWISAAGMFVAGGWLAITKLFPALKQFG
ncbi:MAG: transmembrane Mn(2+) transporter [Verrucomicrobiales bacterium]|nr:transmembrane Mn(2+) transporter [Verrucomicrobiales bacterium]